MFECCFVDFKFYFVIFLCLMEGGVVGFIWIWDEVVGVEKISEFGLS